MTQPDNKLALVKRGGDILREPDKTASVPVPLPVIMVHVDGPYTALDRKLWVLLLHLGWDELLTRSKVGEWHEINEKELLRIFSQYSGLKDRDKLWQSAERLARTVVQYLKGELNDKRWRGVSSLFFAEMQDKEERDGVFRYMFPPALVPILLEPGKFARLKVQFMLGLESKYAVTLYELVESVANQQHPSLECSVEQLRQWLKVPEGKLKQWGELWTRALMPALDEINRKSNEGGLNVTYEIIGGGKGRKVQGIRFNVEKTEQRRVQESFFRKDRPHLPDASTSAATDALAAFSSKVYEIAKKAAPGWDVYGLEKEWRMWGASKAGWPPENPEGAFIAFCKKKGTHPSRRGPLL
jgi:hypothetical protein